MKILTLIILCFLIPGVYAWGWNTHQRLAENVYYSFPLELQLTLNLTLIKDGSIAPDKVFHDNVNHHYPPSYNLSLKWMNLTKYHYENKNYNNASYSFGVLTHYISDSFASPHSISKEDPKLHSLFENQIKTYIQKTKCIKYDFSLKKELEKASQNKDDWQPWLSSKDKLIPEQESEEAQKLLYAFSMNIFNVSCFAGSTSQAHFFITSTTIIIGTIILISVFLLLLNLLKD